jgi:tRNA-splicing ligase RtcB
MWAMIPGSMGTRSYIVTGLQNPMAFASAPHGAGRRYSRTAARKRFTMSDLDNAMQGIEYRRSKVLLDEIPGAYKDIDHVIEHARTLVEVKYVLRQFVNMKGD